jgi:hypothetical protein
MKPQKINLGKKCTSSHFHFVIESEINNVILQVISLCGHAFFVFKNVCKEDYFVAGMLIVNVSSFSLIAILWITQVQKRM